MSKTILAYGEAMVEFNQRIDALHITCLHGLVGLDRVDHFVGHLLDQRVGRDGIGACHADSQEGAAEHQRREESWEPHVDLLLTCRCRYAIERESDFISICFE